MIKTPPSLGRIAAMVLFALSCFGVLTFLWLSFGGSVPLQPKRYRFEVSFPRATTLALQADVRIAGISVGKVVDQSLDPAGNRMLTTLDLDPTYAPIHRDARAILRTKTLGGETYVEVAPGSRRAPVLRDGGRLPNGQVEQAVALEDILNALDPRTRAAFRVWQQDLGRAINRRGPALNHALGNLPQLAQSADDVLTVLNAQRRALSRLVRNEGTVFRALSANRGALRSLIQNSADVFHAASDERAALADTFTIFPTFLDETRLTQSRLQSFAVDTDPLVQDLRPVLRDLRPTLRSARQFAPDLKHVFVNLRPLISVSRRGLPALRDTLRASQPVLRGLGPLLSQLNPVLELLEEYQSQVSDFISLGAGGLNATVKTLTPGSPGHYLRQLNPYGPESASIYRQRLPTNRGNSYYMPLAFSEPSRRLIKYLMTPSWDCANTGAPGDGTKRYSESQPNAYPSCWIAPNLRFQRRRTHYPFVRPADYRGR